MAQSKAMMCYLGFKLNMMGSTEVDRSIILMLIGQGNDLRLELSRMCYYPIHNDFETEKSTFINAYLPRKFHEWERFLSRHTHNGKWFVKGDEPTVVDFLAFKYIDQCLVLSPNALNEFPLLSCYMQPFQQIVI